MRKSIVLFVVSVVSAALGGLIGAWVYDNGGEIIQDRHAIEARDAFGNL